MDYKLIAFEVFREPSSVYPGKRTWIGKVMGWRMCSLSVNFGVRGFKFERFWNDGWHNVLDLGILGVYYEN